MNRAGSLSEMFASSINVLTRPSVSTFEVYERRGSLQAALIYVGVASVIAGVLGLLSGGVLGLIAGLLSGLLNFIVFTGLVYFIGRQVGGTGTFDEVAYTFSLFVAPLIVVGAILGLLGTIPFVGCLTALASLIILVLQVFLGYLAVQSSMNLRDTGKALITLIGAAIGTWIVLAIITGVLVGGAAVGGALTS